MQRSNRLNREPSQEEAEACPGFRTDASAACSATAGNVGVLILQYGDGETVVDMLAMRQDEDELMIPCKRSKEWISYTFDCVQHESLNIVQYQP